MSIARPIRTVLSLLLLVPASSAVAQGVAPPTFQAWLRPEYGLRDLRAFDQALELDDDQRAIVETLLTDYAEIFAARASELTAEIQTLTSTYTASPDDGSGPRAQYGALLREQQERMEAAEDPETRERIRREYGKRIAALRAKIGQEPGARDGSRMREMMARIDAVLEPWHDERVALAMTLTDGVQVTLRDEQQASWPPLERRLRRDRELTRGRLSGETTDLTRLVGDLEISADDAAILDGMLDEYGIVLDAAIRARTAALLASTRSDAGVGALQQEVETRAAICNVNFEWSERVATALPEPAREPFREAFRREAFPRLARKTATDRLFDTALRITGPDPDQHAAIETLGAEYRAEREVFDDAFRAITREHEPRQYRAQLETRWAQGGAESPADDPIAKARRERRELGERYAARLSDLLTEAQREQLPLSRGADGTARSGTQLERQAWVMDRFDADGDGTLNPDELEAVREYLRDRRNRDGEPQ
jgi:hypothetical protein